jgi:hypothetical protein
MRYKHSYTSLRYRNRCVSMDIYLLVFALVRHGNEFIQGGELMKISTMVADKLGWYVYRLIDPRNGETFYVGKGKNNRLFAHVSAVSDTLDDEDHLDLKLQRIKDIRAAGLEVLHVIHRHGLASSEGAFEVEAALIDAYPGLKNAVSGHGSGDFGCRHIQQIIDEYEAKPFTVHEPLILISINQSYDEEEKSIYDAVRGVWRISATKAASCDLVLAHRRGIVLGAFRPHRWLPATRENFPWLPEDIENRIGFEGEPAEAAIAAQYVQFRVPDRYRMKGAANPVRFLTPGD